MIQFLAMGGYAAFVWSAYGLAALVLVGLLVTTLHGVRAKEAAWARISVDARQARRRPRGLEGGR